MTPEETRQALIDKRVILNHVLHAGDHLGTIVDVDVFGRCVVELDTQVKPVKGVVYYDEKPTVVASNLWQICYPVSGGNV